MSAIGASSVWSKSRCFEARKTSKCLPQIRTETRKFRDHDGDHDDDDADDTNTQRRVVCVRNFRFLWTQSLCLLPLGRFSRLATRRFRRRRAFGAKSCESASSSWQASRACLDSLARSANASGSVRRRHNGREKGKKFQGTFGKLAVFVRLSDDAIVSVCGSV